MATSNYDAFVAKVRAWINREDDVLPDSVIEEAMDYAADKAYKTLKIPALEAHVDYTIVDPTTTVTSAYQVKLETDVTNHLQIAKLPIPSDVTFFIHLKIKSSNNVNKTNVVFNEKTDVRTFWDMYADRYTDFFWSRQEGNILVAGALSTGDVIELHYYRRLPALDARYLVTADYFNIGLVTPPAAQRTSGAISLYFPNGTSYPPVAGTDTAYAIQDATNSRERFYFEEEDGIELDNWLRDENRQILLFGTLQQCLDYLDDDVQSQKYKVKFAEAIEEVNKEEKMRVASGGNIQMHFNSQLI